MSVCCDNWFQGISAILSQWSDPVSYGQLTDNIPTDFLSVICAHATKAWLVSAPQFLFEQHERTLSSIAERKESFTLPPRYQFVELRWKGRSVKNCLPRVHKLKTGAHRCDTLTRFESCYKAEHLLVSHSEVSSLQKDGDYFRWFMKMVRLTTCAFLICVIQLSLLLVNIIGRLNFQSCTFFFFNNTNL